MMEIVDRLCPACRTLFSDDRIKIKGIISSDRYKHHDPPSLLQQASQAGCYVCSKVWRRLTSEEKGLVLSTRWWTKWLSLEGWLTGCSSDLGSYSCEPPIAGDGISFVFGPGERGWKEVSFDLHCAAAKASLPGRRSGGHLSPIDLSLHEYISRVVLAPSTGSDRTWETIMSWWNTSMQDCDNTDVGHMAHPVPPGHENGRSIKPAFYPTRLLDLEDTSASPTANLRLSISDEDVRNSPYMTLSYKWRREGEPPADTSESWELTRQTLRDMQSTIPFGDLPITYQDAITVTRRMGIRYLWIDAMCIIQDDVLDWEQEASRMGQVYQQAICNISAGVGTVNDGLFVTRVAGNIAPLQVDAAWMVSSREEGLCHDLEPHHHYLTERNYLIQHLSQASLHNRGWVVQERCLSPRILHFSSEQVFWQQRQHNYCEVFPKGCHRAIDGFYDTVRLEPRPAEWSSPLATWDQVVEQYSATSLTRRTDKMVALAGLAQNWLSNMPEDEYCAGLWKSTFPICLLWKVADGRDHQNQLSYRSAEFLAPSWSWLSVNGKIKAKHSKPFKGLDVRAELLAYSLQPRKAEFELGALEKGAHLVIRCRLKSAKRMYWPMNSLRATERDSNWSIIYACKSPLSARIECSIDDMKCFLQRWNNTVPSEKNWNNATRHTIHTVAAYAIVLGTSLSSLLHHLTLQIIGATLNTASIIFWWSIWHFTNFGSSDLYFAEVCTINGVMTQGLLLQRQGDGSYFRQGTFETFEPKLFADVSNRDTITLF